MTCLWKGCRLWPLKRSLTGDLSLFSHPLCPHLLPLPSSSQTRLFHRPQRGCSGRGWAGGGGYGPSGGGVSARNHTENRCSVRAMLRGRLISTFYSISDMNLARPHRDNASRRLAFGAEAGVTHSHTWVLIESTRYRGGQRRKYHPAWEGSEREQGLEFLDTSPSGRQSPCPLCMTLD